MRTTLTFASALALAVALLPTGQAAASAHRRLPPGWTWGRCLLEVEGRTYLSGRCSYYVGRGGSFEVHGARQTWPGIDYPVSNLFADYVSTDWFAQVDVEGGHAEGLWNHDIRATHAHSELGTLTRRGACWVGAQARVCLWRR